MRYTKKFRIAILFNLLSFYCLSINSNIRIDSLQQKNDTLPKQITDTTNQPVSAVLPDTTAKTIIPDTAKTAASDTINNDNKADSVSQQAPVVTTPPVIPPVEVKKSTEVAPKPVAPANFSADTMKLDTIIKKSGGRMKVKILGKNLFEIMFKMPGQTITKKMSTSSIRELRYANGKIEIIDNTPEKRPKDWVPAVSEVEYSKIIIAKDDAEVANLVDKGEIEANYIAKKMMADNKFLERNALVILRKKLLL